MEKIKWSEKVTNDEVLKLIGEKRVLLDISCEENPNGLAKF